MLHMPAGLSSCISATRHQSSQISHGTDLKIVSSRSMLRMAAAIQYCSMLQALLFVVMRYHFILDVNVTVTFYTG